MEELYPKIWFARLASKQATSIYAGNKLIGNGNQMLNVSYRFSNLGIRDFRRYHPTDSHNTQARYVN